MFKKICFSLSLLLVSASVFAFDPPPLPAGQHVVDLDNKLSSSDKKEVNKLITSLREKHQNNYAALIIPALEKNITMEEVAKKTFKAWSLSKNNGVLLLISVNDHQTWLETSGHASKKLDPSQDVDILRNILAPEIRKGDYTQGIVNVFQKANAILEQPTTA